MDKSSFSNPPPSFLLECCPKAEKFATVQQLLSPPSSLKVAHKRANSPRRQLPHLLSLKVAQKRAEICNSGYPHLPVFESGSKGRANWPQRRTPHCLSLKVPHKHANSLATAATSPLPLFESVLQARGNWQQRLPPSPFLNPLIPHLLVPFHSSPLTKIVSQSNSHETASSRLLKDRISVSETRFHPHKCENSVNERILYFKLKQFL